MLAASKAVNDHCGHAAGDRVRCSGFGLEASVRCGISPHEWLEACRRALK
jgi:hypothetical protein